MVTMPCSHKVYSFPGETTYGSQTCRACLFTAHQQQRLNSNKYQSYINRDLRNEDNIKSAYLVSTVDPVSNFVSPGKEVLESCYEPKPPLINKFTDIRPFESPEFVQHVTKQTIREDEQGGTNVDENAVIEINIQTTENPIVERKEAEKSYGERLLKDKVRLQQAALTQFYKTTTQKMYDDVDWESKMKRHIISPVYSTNQQNMRELNRQIKRADSHPCLSQKISPANWDRLQSRNGFFVNRPIAYTSYSRNTKQIPNYCGSTGGHGEKDIESESFIPLTVHRTDQPKYSSTGRKPYIPGYAGHAHHTKVGDLFSNETQPRLETTARTHSRFNTFPNNFSKFSRNNMVSNSVSLVHPFNPFNKVSFPHSRSASAYGIS